MSKEYLGDSVYVEADRGMVLLTTNNGYPDDPRNKIYIDLKILKALNHWTARYMEILDK